MPPRRLLSRGLPAPIPNLNKPRRGATQTSRFFTLPQELSDMIYAYLLPQTIDCALVQAAGKGRSKNHHVSASPPLALSQVCKQLRLEICNLTRARSLLEAIYICFYAHDLSFYALEGYLTLVAKRKANGLAGFKSHGNSPYISNKLILRITLSKRWCVDPNPESLVSWSKFVRNTPGISEAEQLGEYRFYEVEDKELAVAVMNRSAAGPGIDKEVRQISLAFSNWHMFRGNRQREKWFATEVHKWGKLMRGETRPPSRDYTNDADDERMPLWTPSDNEKESEGEEDSESEDEGDSDDEGDSEDE
ncbi:hypothetical protein B0A55_09342 [Friedmanniomyces simplex]|uniref:F-box domain-containing protein n=1 Tax=Friedmanniomyces simplex TaxID=329884 RepID=A0A4V5NER8_9PEZI|nr:hypothetical protein B0A55_09342 [Friedmanniomyces simplex]